MILFEQCVEGCNNDYCFGEVSHQPGEKGLSIWLAGGQSVDPTRMSFDPIVPVGCPNESTIAGGVGDSEEFSKVGAEAISASPPRAGVPQVQPVVE